MAALYKTAFATAALLLVTGCSGGSLPSAQPGNGGSINDLNVHFTIRVPHGSDHSHRAPHFISPSTKSISISIATSPGGTVAVKLNANLTPASNGCTNSKGATVCQNSVSLAPGTYTATVNTYDAQNEMGNILSEGESLPMKIVAGQSNSISLVLGGVPHSVTLTGTALGITGSQGTGFTLLGSRPLPFAIVAKDADNNTIVGNKSLTYTASIQTGTGWLVQATPPPKAPNTLDLTPPGTNGSTATIKIAFKNIPAGCAQSGAVCTVSFAATNHVQILAVTDCEISCGGTPPDTIMLFTADPPAYGSSSSSGYAPFATIHSGVTNPVAVTIDKAGTLFVANCRVSCAVGTAADSVTVYQPPFSNSSSPAATITNGVAYPTLLAFDSSGDLFVDNCASCAAASSSTGVGDAVKFYSHSNYGGAPTTVASTGQVAGMTVDPNDHLLIAACRVSCGVTGADAILQYAPSYSGAATVITGGAGFAGHTGGLASMFAFDASGDLWSVNAMGTATRYASPLTAASTANVTISSGLSTPLTVASDASGNAFVGSIPGTSDYVSEYIAPSFSGTGTKLFGGAEYQAFEMSFDDFGDAVVSDESTVQVSAPPFKTMTQLATYSSPNGNQPFALSP